MISLRAGRLSRRGAVILASTATGIALVGGGVAWAYWNANTSVPTYAVADSVGAGGAPTASVSGASVNLTWSASTTVGGRAVGGYLINRYPSASGGTTTPAAQGTCAANPVTALTCTEANVPPGTWYYTITPVLGAWHGTESPRSNGVSDADTFTLSGTTTLAAGTPSTLTITAKAGSQTDPGYTGSRTLTFSGPSNAPNGTVPAYNNGSSSVTFTNGVATVPLTLYKAEGSTLSVADGPVTGSLALTVNPAAASQFGVSVPSTTAGAPQTVTLTAQDAYQNKATSYTGSHTLTWSGPGTAPNNQAPSYPSSATFTAGAATATVTLYRAETTTLTTSASSISGTSPSFTVSAAAASQFNVPTPAIQTAGTPFVLTITAQDAYQNTETSYTGSHTLNWAGPGTAPSGQASPSYPSSVTFTAGIANPTITLVKAETPTLRATDGTIAGTSGLFTVNPGAAADLAWINPAATKGGKVSSPCFFGCMVTNLSNGIFTVNVAVTDADGNTVNNIGSGKSVTVAASPDTSAVTPTSLSIPVSGAAQTGTVTFNPQTGNWTTDTLTASFGSFTLSATISK